MPFVEYTQPLGPRTPYSDVEYLALRIFGKGKNATAVLSPTKALVRRIGLDRHKNYRLFVDHEAKLVGICADSQGMYKAGSKLNLLALRQLVDELGFPIDRPWKLAPLSADAPRPEGKDGVVTFDLKQIQSDLDLAALRYVTPNLTSHEKVLVGAIDAVDAVVESLTSKGSERASSEEKPVDTPEDPPRNQPETPVDRARPRCGPELKAPRIRGNEPSKVEIDRVRDLIEKGIKGHALMRAAGVNAPKLSAINKILATEGESKSKPAPIEDKPVVMDTGPQVPTPTGAVKRVDAGELPRVQLSRSEKAAQLHAKNEDLTPQAICMAIGMLAESAHEITVAAKCDIRTEQVKSIASKFANEISLCAARPTEAERQAYLATILRSLIAKAKEH